MDSLALRRLQRDVPGSIGYADGRFTYVAPPEPCHSLACGCECPACGRTRKLGALYGYGPDGFPDVTPADVHRLVSREEAA